MERMSESTIRRIRAEKNGLWVQMTQRPPRMGFADFGETSIDQWQIEFSHSLYSSSLETIELWHTLLGEVIKETKDG